MCEVVMSTAQLIHQHVFDIRKIKERSGQKVKALYLDYNGVIDDHLNDEPNQTRIGTVSKQYNYLCNTWNHWANKNRTQRSRKRFDCHVVIVEGMHDDIRIVDLRDCELI
jgi:hypothetical protein